MKKNYLKMKMMIPAIMLFCCLVQSDVTAENTKMDQKNDAKNSTLIEYHNRMTCFSPLHQCYERIKNNAFYAGVEAWVASGFSEKRNHPILDAEFRMGYNFFWSGREHFTPLIGVGFFKDFKAVHHRLTFVDEDNEIGSCDVKHHKAEIIYATLGFLYDHEFNSIFNLGLNAKGLFGAPIIEFVPTEYDWGKSIVGVDVAMPITFRFGKNRHWDFRIEPFDIYIHGKISSMNYVGLRNTLGYRF